MSETNPGDKYGRLTVVGRVDRPKDADKRGLYFLCKCSCGGEIITRGVDLRSEHVRSCGCLKTKLPPKHYTLDAPIPHIDRGRIDYESACRLITAIATSAADEYRNARITIFRYMAGMMHGRHARERYNKAVRECIDCEIFFKSDRFRAMYDMDGKDVLRDLDDLVNDLIRKKYMRMVR